MRFCYHPFISRGNIRNNRYKMYVPVVNMSAPELKSGFKQNNNLKKCNFELKTHKKQKQHLNNLIDLSIQGVNGLFVLSFKNEAVRTEHTGLLMVGISLTSH